ncbi:MAG: AsmA-like C-terminal region-containing protein [Pseudomonadota bacterium]
MGLPTVTTPRDLLPAFTTPLALAAGGERFSISRPILLSRAPQLTLRHGIIKFARTTKQGGPAALVLIDPILQVGRPGHVNPAALPANDIGMAPLIALVARLGFERMNVRNGRIVVIGANGYPVVLTGIDGTITRNGASSKIAMKGALTFNRERLTFDSMVDLNAQIVKVKASGAKGKRSSKTRQWPLRLTMGGPLLNVAFNGFARADGEGPHAGIRLDGALDAKADNLRALARWWTGRFPLGPGLGAFTAKGQFTLANGRIAFDKAVFSLDGNRATGGLGIAFARPRPAVEATLATQTLDLTPYLPTSPASTMSAPRFAASEDGARALQKAMRASADALVPPAFAAGPPSVDISFNAIRHFDADIRLSAKVVKAGALTFGKTAVSFSVKNNRVLADVASLRMDGGEASGQIKIDMNPRVPHFSGLGRLNNVTVETLLTRTYGAPVIQGRGTVTFALRSQGRTLHRVLRRATGKLSLRMREGATLPGNPALLFSPALKAAATRAPSTTSAPDVAPPNRRRAHYGWPANVRTPTQVDRFMVALLLDRGVADTTCKIFMRGHPALTCQGKLNLIARRLDMVLRRAEPAKTGPAKTRPAKTRPAKTGAAAQARAGQPSAPDDFIVMRGRFDTPIISRTLR